MLWVIKLKRLYFIFALCILLCSCGVKAEQKDDFSQADRLFYISRLDTASEEAEALEFMNAVWVTQFDMHPIYRDGSKQRAEGEYRRLTATMLDNLKRDGFETVFLQVRPNGDSVFESEVYPSSKYIAGVYGGKIEYDAVLIYLELAKERGISVHAWINPYRLCYESELILLGKGILYEWYCEGIGKRIEKGSDGLLYLDPSYEEATELITKGAKEIFEKYDFDGLHIDDYFYPTEFEFDDEHEFFTSGYDDKGEFRRANADRTVKALYQTAHEHGKVFGVSPAGNIYSLENGWYIDIYKWLSTEGYVDYIMPQLYFGFKNAVCPFERVLDDWASAVKCDKIKLYVGLSAAKCALGAEGVADAFAGSEGKFEWRDDEKILARSYIAVREKGACGVCIFSYSSFYDSLTGIESELTDSERRALLEEMKKQVGE